MFRPVRLLMLAALAGIVYAGFFAVPDNDRSVTSFDPDLVARYEVGVWQAAIAQDDVATYISVVQMLREQQRYTWYHAADAAFNLSRATGTFVNMTTRFERILPDLEEAAKVERDWRKADFVPAVAARAQLTAWVALKLPSLNTRPDVPQIVGTEFGIRYGMDPREFDEAASYRADAIRMRDGAKIDPDWPAITKLLARSYRSLRAVLERRSKLKATPRRTA